MKASPGIVAACASVITAALAAHAQPTSGAAAAAAGDQALRRLLAGNKRFVAARPPEHRSRAGRSRQPFAILIGCSDWRAPAESVFGQAPGDLFVVRTAGNSVDEMALGDIEYAAEHLGAALIVVLGHERCGVKPPGAGVALTVDRLKTSRPILAGLAAKNRLKIVGAHYDPDTGTVEIIRP